jgi:ParB family chromosome partitioning protein
MTTTRPRGLGRGLQALIPLPSDNQSATQMIAIDQVRPSTEQMRRRFPADSMRDLTESIRQHGVLQPILVRRVSDGFELIAGERRWRAAKQAGLERIPAVIRAEAGDDDSLLLGLIENLQREDLDPIEEARGIQRLIEQFGLTHEEAAGRLGRHRVAISQSLRLLQGSPAVVSATAAGAISAGHARAIVGLDTPEDQDRALRVVLAKQLNVRQTERWVRTYRPAAPRRREASQPASTRELEERIRDAVGAPVSIVGVARGRLIIEFSSRSQLEAIAAKLIG